MKRANFIIAASVFIFLAIVLAFALTRGKPTKFVKNSPYSAVKARSLKPKAKTATNNNAFKTAANEKIKLYFSQGDYLIKEEREAKKTPENSLRLLLKGPLSKQALSYIPKNTRLISFAIKNKKAIVNFSKEILNPGNVGARAEELTIYSITNTLTEFKQIKEVEIQIEGKTKGEIDGLFVEDFWGHIGLYDQPFRRNETLIKGRGT